MGSRARREKEKANMKRVILNAATKIILEDGYDKLTMRKIADAIDYTPTTLYLYYRDKAQIVSGILQEVYQKITDHIIAVLAENENAPAITRLELSLKAFVNAVVDSAEMGNAIVKSGMKTVFEPSAEDALSGENGMVILHNILLDGQRQGVFRQLDDNVCWMLITALIGFSMDALENRRYLDANWDSLVHTYTELLVRGLLQNN